MTTNQRRAAVLAEQIFLGACSPEALSDHDWSLLLLAAGTNAVAAPPARVSHCVLQRASEGSGYFGTGAYLEAAVRERQHESISGRHGLSG